MIVLVSGATKTMRRLLPHPHLGILITPRAMQSIDWLVASGSPWAADNDCFRQLDPDRYIAMVDRLYGRSRQCVFVTVPDEVGDHDATRELWDMWSPYILESGLPPAFVLQDGATSTSIPWHSMKALFVGGSTTYKESPEALALCREAKRRGIWVHVGRVNTNRRERHFLHIADSFDGTKYSMFADRYIPPALARLSAYDNQLTMNI